MNTNKFNLTKGAYIKKDAGGDNLSAEQAYATLTTELSGLTEMLSKSKKEYEDRFVALNAEFKGVKADSDEIRADATRKASELAGVLNEVQSLTAAIDAVRKELDAPMVKGGSDLIESDKLAAIELQRRAHIFKGHNEEDFRPDMSNLVVAADYRSAARKMMRGGVESLEAIIKSFSTAERKAFDAASLDSAFFSPQMLGIEVDCEIECAELLDLYMPVSVSRSNFMYPHVNSYGDIGKYECDAKCDTELGPEGNITYNMGKTFDFRGIFCFQRKVLQEANYDLLGFMMRAAARSHRINRNRSLIVGDGVNEPKGWLSADCFTKVQTDNLEFNHIYFRRFMSSAPVEYGEVIATMHQNVFGYLSSQVDNNGRFIFGDGLMSYSPDDVRERIRISNCLPDATANNTLGSTAAPFVAGSFLAAAGNWKMAYAAVEKTPMRMEQFIGGSTMWCAKYQFEAQDGGFVTCCAAARTLVVGA